MATINEHITDAHYHLVAAAMLLERDFITHYPRDVQAGRILGLLDLHDRLQEVKRLAAAVQRIAPPPPMAAEASAEWPVSASGAGPADPVDAAA